MNYISLRQKIAGKAEAKKVTGLNFEEVRNKLISEGIEPTRDEITTRLLDESNLVISNNQKDLILNLNLSESTRKRVNEIEAALIIIGAVLDGNNIDGIIETFNWYLETMELKPGSLGISQADISNISAIKESFEKLYNKISEEKRASDKRASSSKGDSYLSNEVVYDFGDGWKVVYVPAVGEMESFPGLNGTSHDRILEGNKNGLCLGSGSRYYQNNNSGKIYSIRDPENKPRVTIRINKNYLEEAKGKNNNPPDIEAAKKANTWFENVTNLNYKNSGDYKNFPPLNLDIARESFLKNKDKAYDDLWAPHWYGKGIEELDKDVDDNIKNLNPIIITAGFGKYPIFFEKIKPIVIRLCEKYINNKDKESKAILFGSIYNPPTHEVFKTYKKLSQMQDAVEIFSKDEDNYKHFFSIGLHEIKEYEKYIDIPAKFMAEKNNIHFIRQFSEKPWAKPYLNLAANKYAKYHPFDFLKDLLEKPSIEPYIDLSIIDFAVKHLLEKSPYDLIEDFADTSWAQPYIDLAAKKYIEINPSNFLVNFSEKPWAQPYIDLAAKSLAEKYPHYLLENFSEKSWAGPYIDLAVNNFINEDSGYENSGYFLYKFSEKPWAQPYIDLAAKKYAEEHPDHFLEQFSKESWAQPYIDFAKKNYKLTFNWRIHDNMALDWDNMALDQYSKKKSSYNNNSLIKLSRALNDFGFNYYGYAVNKLSKY
jgi:hypothetical protein